MFYAIGVYALLVVSAFAVNGMSFSADLPCRSDSQRPTHGHLPEGVVSVEVFGADAMGKRDSTASLQDALTHARTHNVTLFVPFGCYQISDTLVVTQPRNGRWQPTQIVGQRPESGSKRPAFVLPPATEGFTDKSKYKPMMTFWTNWCLYPGSEESLYFQSETYQGKIWCGKKHSMPPWMFNMLVQDIDFIIGSGNKGAVGLDMVGAQGSTIQDVTVYAVDSFAGVVGGNGGGGMFGGIAIHGGLYGLDARQTDGSATYSSITLVNQSCAGVIVGPNSRSTSAFIGLHVSGSPKLGGIYAAMATPEVSSSCYAPPRITPEHFDAHSFSISSEADVQGPSSALSDAVTVIDSFFDIKKGSPCVNSNASLWIQNLYSNGCVEVVRSGGKAVVIVPNPCKDKSICHWHINEFALGRQNWEGLHGKYKYSFPSIIDGHRRESMLLHTDDKSAPADLISRHHWGSSSVDWQSEGAVNAKEFGAKGDGISDDWHTLQVALNENNIVVLPRGLYRLSRPLVMRRRGSSLVGVGQARSFLMPVSKGFSPQEQPVLDMAADDATVKGVTILTWSHLASTYAINWRGNGVWRQAFTSREPESIFPPFKNISRAVLPEYTPPVDFDRALVVISGGGAFYDFDLDFGCCFGTLNPKNGSIGPGTASNNEVLLQRPNFRTLLINGSRSGLRFYPHNTEQAFSDAYTEIRHSFNVTLYNAKSENNYVVIWIRDSDFISVHGFGGNFCPFPNSSSYNDVDVREPFLPYSYQPNYTLFMPSSFRVQRSTRVTLANIVNAERITDGRTSFISAGIGYDPHTYNMILYQDEEGICNPLESPSKCSSSPVLDRPVLWRVTDLRQPGSKMIV